MFYPTLCLKMGVYFQNGFELNIAEYKLLRFTIPHLEVDSGNRNCTHAIASKQIAILFTYFLIIIMIREYCACFILHSA